MISDTYRAQVDLLLQVLPQVAKEDSFALKGGTAINLFVRDMPRLSVDIDLAYNPLTIAQRHLRVLPMPCGVSRHGWKPSSPFAGFYWSRKVMAKRPS
jgi:hypothetical protein